MLCRKSDSAEGLEITDSPQSRRRDSRYALPTGGGVLEFELPGAGRLSGRLVAVSSASLDFEMDDVALEPGATVDGVVVRFGPCEIRGDLSVVRVRRANRSGVQVGCLFYPASLACEEKWIAVLAGIEAMCVNRLDSECRP